MVVVVALLHTVLVAVQRWVCEDFADPLAVVRWEDIAELQFASAVAGYLSSGPGLPIVLLLLRLQAGPFVTIAVSAYLPGFCQVPPPHL